MKNFKKVLFGGLVSLMMVTSASATMSQNGTYWFDNAITDEDSLKTCLETAKADVRCTVTDDFTITKGNINIAGDVVTLNLGNHTVKTGGFGFSTAAGKEVIINGGTINTDGTITVNGDLTINNTVLTSKNSTKIIDISGTSSGKSNVTLNNVTATNKSGNIITYTKDNAIVSLSGSYTTAGTVIDVKAGAPEITLNGTFTSTDGKVYVEAAAVTSKLNINNGNYTSEDDTFTVGASTVKVDNATITSNGGSAIVDAAKATVTITSGNLTAKEDTVSFTNGSELTVETASVKSTDAAAINQGNGKVTIKNGTFTGKENTISANGGVTIIENGTFTSEGELALNLVSSTTTSKINGGHYVAKGKVSLGTSEIIYGGSFEGNNEGNVTETAVDYSVAKSKGYAAVRIGDVVYVGKTHTLKIRLENDENMDITFVNNDVASLLEGHEYKFADDATKEFINIAAKEGYTITYSLVYGKGNSKTGTVTAEGFVMPEEDAVLIVKAVPSSEVVVPGENQGEQGNPTEPGKDNEPSKNPNTFDGIASFVTLAISSLGAAGYSIKKVIKR